MAVNASLPPIPEPLADLAALTAVARALKQRVEALTERLAVLTAGTTTTGSGGSGGSYTLPVASTVTLGGIKVDGVTVTISGGVLTAAAGTGALPATSAPLMDGTVAIGVSARYARQDHVHPHDTANPAGYQTAADVALAVASSAYMLTTAKFGVLNLSTLPAVDMGAVTGSEAMVTSQAGVTRIWEFNDLYRVITDVFDYAISANPLNATVVDTNGSPVYFVAGAGNGNADGGEMGLYGGDGGTTSGNGGQIRVQAGNATDGDGGQITLQAGNAGGSGNGGQISLLGGDDAGSGASGAIYLATQDADNVGGIILQTGFGASTGGSIILQPGASGGTQADIQLLLSGGNLVSSGLPTSDPLVPSDAVWADVGVLMLSGHSLPTALALRFGSTILSGLPTINPGSGFPWLNGGVLQVGA